MRELTIKEKAEAYERAIARAKEHAIDGYLDAVAVNELFPELAEVKDEDIKRWVINEIKIKHHSLDEEDVDFVDKAIAWLEKQGTKNTAWSKLDEALLKLSLENLTELKDRYGKGYGRVGDCIVWLKALKKRVGSEANCTTTKEWSEQDEYNKRQVCRVLRDAGCSQNVQDRINSWLETFRFQTHWKPNKEQIAELQNAIGTVGELTNRGCILKELKAELVKLIRV